MVGSLKIRLQKKWWFRYIRGYNWFSFRYWWFNYVLWTLLISLLVFLLCKLGSTTPGCGETYEQVNRKLRDIHKALENCCPCLNDSPENRVDSTISELDHLRDSLGGCTGEITVTLRWSTTDDLDLMVVEPNGNTVFFKNKNSGCNGVLDIDRNFEEPFTENAIENICYSTTSCSGKYRIGVLFYKRHSRTKQVPYFLYVNVRGKVSSFEGVHSVVRETHEVHEFIINP